MPSRETMSRLRRRLYQTVKPLREYIGYDLINRNKFGYDPFLDIRRLAIGWGLPVKRFFDVGANEGRFAEVALSYFPNVEIFAFEPHPDTFLRLVQRVRGRRLFHAHNVALGNKIGQATLFEYGSSDLNSLVPNAPHAVRFPQPARGCRYRAQQDDFCATNGLDTIDVLKIDTEGFDFEVIRGARKLLGVGAIRFIYFEFNEILGRDGVSGGELAPIAMLISPFGYRFVATYTDRIVTEGEMLGISNALFVLPPGPQLDHAGEHDAL